MTLVAIGCASCAPTAFAQSNQRLSMQVSGLVAALQGAAYRNLAAGRGGEAQLRVTPGGPVSLGGGIQYTRHDFALAGANFPVALWGPFVEPRYAFAIGLRDVGGYVSTRFSILRQGYSVREFEGSSMGVTLNGGGGAIVRLGARTNLDIGATYGFTRFRRFRIRDREAGRSYELDAGNGSNVVVRVGLAIGLLR